MKQEKELGSTGEVKVVKKWPRLATYTHTYKDVLSKDWEPCDQCIHSHVIRV